MIATRNQLEARLTIVQGDARTVELPVAADVIVSEMMGNLGPEEELAEVVAAVARASIRSPTDASYRNTSRLGCRPCSSSRRGGGCGPTTSGAIRSPRAGLRARRSATPFFRARAVPLSRAPSSRRRSAPPVAACAMACDSRYIDRESCTR